VSLRIATLNVKGLNEDEKRREVLRFISKVHRYDIVCLQETHCGSDSVAAWWTKQWGGRALWTTTSSSKVGVALLLSNNICAWRIADQLVDPAGRFIHASLFDTDSSVSIRVHAVYAPNTAADRAQFFSDQHDLTDLFADDDSRQHPAHAIVLGDVNCVDDPQVDKIGGNHDLGMDGSLSLRAWTTSLGTCDAWRALHPTTRAVTYMNHATNVGTRIDRIFAPAHLVDDSEAHTVPFPLSDHDGVALTLHWAPIERGRGYWQLNASLLAHHALQDELASAITSWQHPRYRSHALSWEALKRRLRTVCVRYSVRVALVRAAARLRAQQDYDAALATWATTSAAADAATVQQARLALGEMDEVDYEAAALRSKVNWQQLGERPTRFFCSLERSRRQSSSIAALNHPTTAEHCTEPAAMCNAAADFYRHLYTPAHACDSDKTDQLLNHLPSLPADVAQQLDAPISLTDLTAALNKTSRGKTPGVDGLPSEFYRVFWPLLGPILLRVLQEAVDDQLLPESMRRAVLILLHKKDDRSALGNYRPLSMLCADQKILGKVLALRLEIATPLLVHPDQTGFVRGRNIHDNVLLIRSILAHCRDHNQAGILLSLDEEKAFDRLLWTYRDRALVKLGFGPYLRSLVTTLYTDADAVVLVNGHLSTPINIQCGTRQGCPASPLLYALVAESLACAVRAHPGIQGLPLPEAGYGRTALISLYADDKDIMLKDNASLLHLDELLDKYECASGAKINARKSSAILLGSSVAADFPSLRYRILSGNESVSCLGVSIGPATTDRDIWMQLNDKLDSTLALWAHRDLSTKGRLTVLRTMACSKLWYVAAVVPPPPDIEKQLNTSCWRFFWRGRAAGPVAREYCLSPAHLGGLGMFTVPNTIDALIASTLQRLNDTSDAKWKAYAIDQVRNSKFCKAWGHGLGMFSATIKLDNNSPFALGPYWTRAFSVAQRLQLHEMPPTSVEQVMRQPLFYNDAIRGQDGASLGDRTLAKLAASGTRVVGHLVDADDNLRRLTAQELGATPAIATKIFDAVPAAWWAILQRGFQPPTVGEFFLDTRDLPASHVLRASAINLAQNSATFELLSLNLDGVLLRETAAHAHQEHLISTLPLIRAHVQDHWLGWLVAGPADCIDVDERRLIVDQRRGSRTTKLPLDKLTVRGTTTLLNHLQAKRRNFTALWLQDLDRDDTIPWRRVWAWVWAPYRDRKVADHLWRLLNRSLALGVSRRAFAADTSFCCVCSTTLETYAHFTFDCPVVHQCLAWFLAAWRATTDLRIDLNRRSAIFASLPSTSRRQRHPARSIVFSIAHGELLYTLWLGRCRCTLDNELDAFMPPVLAVTAIFRMRRAFATLCATPKYAASAAAIKLVTVPLLQALQGHRVQDFK
jgi:exonuclease III